MTEAMKFALSEPVQAHRALDTAWHRIKPLLLAGHRLVLTVKPETRRDGQNSHFHKLIGEISDHMQGELADKDDAKRILLSAFRIDTINDPDFAQEWKAFGDMRIGRGLRGETVLLGNQTRDLNVKLAAAFIIWLEAFGAEHGVQFKAPKSWDGMDAR